MPPLGTIPGRQVWGSEFVEEILSAFDAISQNPHDRSRRHPLKNVHWRYSQRFPYRIVYEVLPQQNTVVIACVIHAARHNRHWKKRVTL
jgi:plasmid stabilization system protein ParE